MTVIEIARLAGVSIGTVDRVLHNRGRVSLGTRQKIESIISAAGYQPNPVARHLKRNRDYPVGVLIPELDKESRYWNLIHAGIVQAAAELSAFSFTVRLFEFIRPDPASLARSYDRMLASDCSAYIIAPVMQEETARLLTTRQPEVPYAFIDCALPGASPLSTVAQDPFRGGYLAGRLMNLLAGPVGPFAVIRPYTEAFNLNERARGFQAWFADRPGVRLLDLICPEINMAEARKVLEGVLRDEQSLKGLFVVATIVHEIADIVASSGRKKDITIVGYDLVEENIRCLEDGRIDCLISQRPEEQGRRVLHQLYRKIILEEKAERDIEMPFDIFFRENLPILRS